MELNLNDLDLIEIQFTLTNEHQKLLSDIYVLKEVIAEKNLFIDLRVVLEWMYEAFMYVYKTADESKTFSRNDICYIHKCLGLTGEFRTRKLESTCVQFGTDYPYFPPDAEEIPALMKKYEDRYSHFENTQETLQRICEAYFIFELIHPFEDGNGRTGRLICAWMMLQNSYGFLTPLLEKRWGGERKHRIEIFKSSNNNYYGCLGNPETLNEHFSRFYFYFLGEIKILIEEMLENKT